LTEQNDTAAQQVSAPEKLIFRNSADST